MLTSFGFVAGLLSAVAAIRFILFNNEVTGLHGASAYVAQRKDLLTGAKVKN